MAYEIQLEYETLNPSCGQNQRMSDQPFGMRGESEGTRDQMEMGEIVQK